MKSDGELLRASRLLSEALTPGDLDHTLSRITHAAVQALSGVEHCSVTVYHRDGRLESAAPTDGLATALDQAQYEHREGPCYAAATSELHVVSSDLATDERFPRYGRVAVEAGVRSQAGIRLFETPTSTGVLNLYAATTGAFENFGTVTALFSHQAASAISYAHEIRNLNEAIQTRKLIGQAMGIVMERYQLTDEQAFAFLTRLSQSRNVKLRLVAQEIVAASDSRAEQ